MIESRCVLTSGIIPKWNAVIFLNDVGPFERVFVFEAPMDGGQGRVAHDKGANNQQYEIEQKVMERRRCDENPHDFK